MGRGSSVAASCGAGQRCSSDPALLWLWCMPVATARIQPLAWELSCASGAALENSLSLSLFFFSWLHLQHMEIPGPGVKLAPQQQHEPLQ